MSAALTVHVDRPPRRGGRHRSTRRTASAGRSRSSRSGLVLSGLGQALLTLGFVVLLFGAYELWVTGLFTAHEQTRLRKELTATWERGVLAAPAAPATPATGTAPPSRNGTAVGSGLALLYLPTVRHGPLVIVEGVGVDDLKKGPGHLPGSAQPGRPGNTVLSGHRTTYGAPFGDLDRLRPGDVATIRTRESSVTYRITGSQVVAPSALDVTYPVPGRPGMAPTTSVLTMTTCNPKYSAAQRLVVRGVLVDSVPAAAGAPAGQGG